MQINLHNLFQFISRFIFKIIYLLDSLFEKTSSRFYKERKKRFLLKHRFTKKSDN
jgi:hypothetical protein